MLGFNARIRAAVQAAGGENVADILNEMLASGLAPDLRTYTALTVSHAKVGDVHGAFGLLRQLRQDGLQPDLHVVNTVLGACARAGDIDNAARLYAELARPPPPAPPPHPLSADAALVRCPAAFSRLLGWCFARLRHHRCLLTPGLAPGGCRPQPCLLLSPDARTYTTLFNCFTSASLQARRLPGPRLSPLTLVKGLTPRPFFPPLLLTRVKGLTCALRRARRERSHPRKTATGTCCCIKSWPPMRNHSCGRAALMWPWPFATRKMRLCGSCSSPTGTHGGTQQAMPQQGTMRIAAT